MNTLRTVLLITVYWFTASLPARAATAPGALTLNSNGVPSGPVAFFTINSTSIFTAISNSVVTTIQSTAQTNLLWGNTVFVSTYGNDSTGQRNSLALPFRTPGAAKTNALAGDTVFMLPGNYTGNNLLKGDVNWHWFNGARNNWTNPVTGTGWGTYDDRPTGAVTSNITGDGIFGYFHYDPDFEGTQIGEPNTINANVRGFFIRTNALSKGDFRAKSVEMTLDSGGLYGQVAAFYLIDGAAARFDVDYIFDPDPNAFSDTSGVYWESGDLVFNCREMRVPVFGLYSHDRESLGYDIYYAGQVMESTRAGVAFYHLGKTNSPNFKSWVEVTEIIGACNLYGGGKVYILKCGKSSGPTAFTIHGPPGPEVWVQAQKVQATGKWVDIESAWQSRAVFEVGDWVSAANQPVGFEIGAHTGNVTFLGGIGTITNGVGMTIAGGTNRFKNFTLDTSLTDHATNNRNNPVQITGGKLILDHSTLLAPPSAPAIYATGASTVYAWGSWANKTNMATVTLAPTAGITISADVQ